MIKQILYFDDMELLTLYHNGFEDYDINRKIEKKVRIGNNSITFFESYIDNLNGEEIEADDIMQGFLYVSHKRNPYSSYCCDYREYIVYDKASWQENLLEDKGLFRKISKATRKWSGFDLSKNPLTIGNTLIFTPCFIDLDIRCDQNNSIHVDFLENIYEKLIIIVKFKFNNIIVDVKIYNEIIQKINTDKLWDSIDIEIYSENKNLIYARYDMSWMDQINMRFALRSREIKTQLKTQKRSVEIGKTSTHSSQTGKKKNAKLTNYMYKDNLLFSNLKNRRFFKFLTKDQRKIAFNILEKLTNKYVYNEAWIFDPYFINYNITGGKDNLYDVLLILSTNLSLKKHIVFTEKEDKIEQKFKEFLDITNSVKRSTGIQKLNFHFYGTKEYFHDRFIFLINRKTIKGYLIGTSLNSFGDNYSTIIELEDSNAKEVFLSLEEGVLKLDNILLEREI